MPSYFKRNSFVLFGKVNKMNEPTFVGTYFVPVRGSKHDAKMHTITVESSYDFYYKERQSEEVRI